MNPQTVALISHCGPLSKSVAQTLGHQVSLVESDNPKDLSHHHLLLLHHFPPLGNCLEWLPRLKKEQPHRPVVVIASGASPHEVAEAFRLGASDFLFEPLDADVLLRNCFKTSTI